MGEAIAFHGCGSRLEIRWPHGWPRSHDRFQQRRARPRAGGSTHPPDWCRRAAGRLADARARGRPCRLHSLANDSRATPALLGQARPPVGRWREEWNRKTRRFGDGHKARMRLPARPHRPRLRAFASSCESPQPAGSFAGLTRCRTNRTALPSRHLGCLRDETMSLEGARNSVKIARVPGERSTLAASLRGGLRSCARPFAAPLRFWHS